MCILNSYKTWFKSLFQWGMLENFHKGYDRQRAQKVLWVWCAWLLLIFPDYTSFRFIVCHYFTWFKIMLQFALTRKMLNYVSMLTFLRSQAQVQKGLIHFLWTKHLTLTTSVYGLLLVNFFKLNEKSPLNYS